MGLFKILFIHFKCIIKAYLETKKAEGQCNQWFGIFEEGTEEIVALTGAGDSGKIDAIMITQLINEAKNNE